ncbi:MULTISPECIES: thiol-disulfide oxidoreductase DCC family protein [Streptomyces]|uniref:thiol-disulfide oxidoreductase DCC family protein n=1 Tax=Streptomyces TaxID=1883 RepID=UPI00099D68E6|nr:MULTISPECIES: DCC1-like thiol-disulfide oxidoreductase family protein [Streptomyces]WBY21715.1 DCC1-like thiol-disulfide oxidoreductase family protein [Streptomyces goshikiensis]
MAPPTAAPTGARTAPGAPAPTVRHLTVLYDAQCPLCVHIRHWLLGQRLLVPLRLVPAGSEAARRRYPLLDHAGTLRQITVVGDSGQVWSGTDAFIVCLWALAEHRPRANWLATPAGRPFARAAMYTASAWRSAVRGGGEAEPEEPACDDQCATPR